LLFRNKEIRRRGSCLADIILSIKDCISDAQKTVNRIYFDDGVKDDIFIKVAKEYAEGVYAI
jgi:hypothetical protein